MTAIGVYDAKTQLPKLLDRVSRGERFTITKHGRPVAELIPAGAAAAPDVKQVIQQMQEWQEREGAARPPGRRNREPREEGKRVHDRQGERRCLGARKGGRKQK